MNSRELTLANLLLVLAALLGISSPRLFAENPPVNVVGPIPHLPWLHEGLVLNGTWTTMIFPGRSMDFVEDEHGKIHMADGTNLKATPRQGTSAGGVTAARVSCIDGNKVCLISNSFSDMRLLGSKDPVPQHMPLTFIFDAAQCDLWIDPVRLAEMRNDVANHKLVVPIQLNSGARLIDAIRITVVQANHYSDRIFDRKTGLCIHLCDISKGAAPKVNYFLRGEPPEGDTMVVTGDFLAARDADTPWAGEPMPPWTGKFKALHYRGTSGIVAGAFAPALTPIGVDVTNPQTGNGWLGVAVTRFAIFQGQPMFPSKSVFICGRNQFDGFFAGPAGLAKLHAGQILDEDPITHMQTVASQIDDRSVTITSSNTGGKAFHRFDRNSGKLLAWGTFDNMSHMQTSLQLQAEE